MTDKSAIQTSKARVVFLGTPHFALPTLKALVDSDIFDVFGILTQPDKPAGRGQKLTPPPVKAFAQELGIPVFQPVSLRKDLERIAWLKDCRPDFLVTAAFGQILSEEVLKIPRYGTVNVHASLLPALRGPNPVQWAILLGLQETGITTMLTDIGVDTGDILLQSKVEIGPTDTALDVTERLADAGGALLVKTLQGLLRGEIKPTPQNHEVATHAPKLDKEQALIDWKSSAQTLDLRIRGQQPSPGAYTFLNGERVKLLRSRFDSSVKSPPIPFQGGTLSTHNSDSPSCTNTPTSFGGGTLPTLPQSENFVNSSEPGVILGMMQEGLCIQTGHGILEILEVQPAGKRMMTVKEWVMGLNMREGCLRFSSV